MTDKTIGLVELYRDTYLSTQVEQTKFYLRGMLELIKDHNRGKLPSRRISNAKVTSRLKAMTEVIEEVVNDITADIIYQVQRGDPQWNSPDTSTDKKATAGQ